jgi:CRP-like cAMP-binding protein
MATVSATLEAQARRLRSIPLLEGLDDKELWSLAASLSWREVRKGTTVLHKGTAGDHLLFLMKGSLQVLDITESGQEIGLNLLRPGDHFGELSVIDGGARSASIVAMEHSEVALMPKAVAWGLFHHNPLVAQRILSSLAQKLRTASVYQTILCLPNAAQRVHALLQRLARRAPGNLVVIDHAPKQRELAILANTSRETVSRTLTMLVEQGIVEKDNSRLIVRRPQELRRLAMFEAPDRPGSMVRSS